MKIDEHRFTMRYLPFSIFSENRLNNKVSKLDALKKPPMIGYSVELQPGGVPGAKSCTKRAANENFAYMTSPTVWPAYHGWGGSFWMVLVVRKEACQIVAKATICCTIELQRWIGRALKNQTDRVGMFDLVCSLNVREQTLGD